MDNDIQQLQAILDASNLSADKKQDLLLKSVAALAPAASQQAAMSAGGDFLKILMQLLMQFLPILLKLLAGG